MAKCLICSQRKGKRSCKLKGFVVCPICCAETRIKEKCRECYFYKEQKRNYSSIPCYTPEEMEESQVRQTISDIIESEICNLDFKNDFNLRDEQAIRILELVLDKYYFGELTEEKEPIANYGYQLITEKIKRQLSKVDKEELIKIIAAIYFVANRWNTKCLGKRNYLNVIREYVGLDIKSFG